LELINASSKELKGAINLDKKTFAFRVRTILAEAETGPGTMR